MKLAVVGIIVALAVFSGWFILNKPSSEKASPSPLPVVEEMDEMEPVNFTASFEIHTNGTKRIFTDARYHNQSERVFISPNDTSSVQVRSEGVTWGEFFETLPMELSEECLVTGTGQRFCDGENASLRFYVNNELTPNFLEKQIEKNDQARIVFGS